MDLASLRDRLLRLLPIMIILSAIFGMALYAVRNLVPELQTFNVLNEAVGTYSAVVETQIAAQDNSDSIVILERQIERLETELSGSTSIFLTREESEQVLNRLYGYAYSRGVRVITLQAQQPADVAVTSDAPYEVTTLQLQVTGGIANLIDFVAHIREATLPGVSIQNLSVTRTENETTLTMIVRMYTSPFASGEALSQIPSPTPTLEPSATIPTPTYTPTETPTETPTYTPTTTEIPPTSTPTFAPTLTPTLEPTSEITEPPTLIPATREAIIECPGAPTSLFRVGDIAIVDFNGLGALRLLADPHGGVMSTRTQAYDNHVLEIIAGPVCVTSSYYWYVRNLSNSDTLGWAAEAVGDQRYMCPESNPECTDIVPGGSNP